MMSGVNGSLKGFNLYAYCFNNPVMMTDSEGNWPDWFEKTKENVQNWFNENIVKVVAPLCETVTKFVADLREDKNNYDSQNELESVVYEANYFSSYKGAFVLKTSFKASFSFGFIGLSRAQQNSTTLNHEYGHYKQFKNLECWNYFTDIAIPSITANVLHRLGKLQYDYYTSPWESEADALGGVNNRARIHENSWEDGGYNSYFDLIKHYQFQVLIYLKQLMIKVFS